MTDGILLAELQRDRTLRKYDTIIIDEAHERSLNIDFLLGYLRRLLPRRPDLKLIITSATIDVDRFAAALRTAPGRSRSPAAPTRRGPLPAADGAAGGATRRASRSCATRPRRSSTRSGALGRGAGRHPGLPARRAGDPRHRRRASTTLKRDRLEIVPLYSRLSAPPSSTRSSPPHRVVRRVVLATNVAETSLTVPGIRYVVDTGVARISRYSVRTKVQRLPIEPISQASANQRSGRCGRVAAGIAIRLYSEEDFEAPPGVHRPGDPADQPGQRHPADGLARARRHRPLPVRRAAGQAQRRRPASQLLEELGASRRPTGGGQAPAARRSAGGWPGCRSTRGSAG